MTLTTPVILGGSVSGLATGLFLARRGVGSVVIEQDPGPVGPQWATRRPTPQAGHSHAFLSAGRDLLAEEAPDVLEALRSAGAAEIPLEAGEVSLACRRSTFEAALRRSVMAEPLVDLCLGATVTGLCLEPTRSGQLHAVTGVQLAGAAARGASVVIDAGGRRTPVDGWLAGAGVAVNDRSEECGIAYYSRFYQLLPGATASPLNRGFTGGGSFDRYSSLVFPADDGAFSVTFGVLPEDRALRALRHGPQFDAAARTIPVVAPWLAPGRSVPVSDVATMTGMRNGVRHLAQDGTPTVVGLVKVGDAAATTNPAHTRGCTLALLHARALADLLAAPPPPLDLAVAADALVSQLLEPWVDDSMAQDRMRMAAWRGEGAVDGPGDGSVTNGQAFAASTVDAAVRAAFTKLQQLRFPHPAAVLADPDVVRRVRAALGRGGRPPRLPAPSHDALAALAAGGVSEPAEDVIGALVG